MNNLSLLRIATIAKTAGYRLMWDATTRRVVFVACCWCLVFVMEYPS